MSSTESKGEYRIAPINYIGTIATAKGVIKQVLANDPAAQVVAESDDYIHATYTTSLMRYVDDVEFVFAEPGRIDLRSSSRIGYADLGLNKRRMEDIRRQFAELGGKLTE